jgi:hypothetical protein
LDEAFVLLTLADTRAKSEADSLSMNHSSTPSSLSMITGSLFRSTFSPSPFQSAEDGKTEKNENGSSGPNELTLQSLYKIIDEDLPFKAIALLKSISITHLKLSECRQLLSLRLGTLL